LASTGLSFKYPSNWTVPSGGSDATGIEVHSPDAGGYYFTIDLASGTNQDVNMNFLGNSPGLTLVKLVVPGSASPLYLVAQTVGSNGEVTGLGLATTPGNAKTSFGILDDGGRGNDNLTMSANLIPSGSGSGVNNPYTLQTYQVQADYQTVLKVFESLSSN
jgi:hypothetical protein